MACYRIEWKASARKELRGLERAILGRVLTAVEALATDPRPDGCRKLAGSKQSYRIRVGDYRVVYLIEDDRLIVEIIRVRHRSAAYHD